MTSKYTETWLEIGKRNPWINEACDPPFDKDSFHHCADEEELKEKFEHGNWTLGQSFCLEDLCFIQQVNGGDEWLTIKKNLSFESIYWQVVIRRGEFYSLLNDLQTASLEQCRNLEYRHTVPPTEDSPVHRCNTAKEVITILSRTDKT